MSDPVFLVDALPSGPRTTLGGPEGHHAAAVRRLRAGETLLLTDGVGGLARCEVAAARRDALDLTVGEIFRVPAPDPQVTVVQALPKGDRGELAVELLTEAGVDVVVPWRAARCVTRWRDDRGGRGHRGHRGDRGDKALRRWRATAREAAKQSRRAWLPEVADAASTTDVARLLTAADVALVLHEEAKEPLAAVPLPAAGTIVLVVGPEGGIAPDELDAFAAAGGRGVRLGDTVLRTSTAGVAALAIVNARTPRWR